MEIGANTHRDTEEEVGESIMEIVLEVVGGRNSMDIRGIMRSRFMRRVRRGIRRDMRDMRVMKVMRGRRGCIMIMEVVGVDMVVGVRGSEVSLSLFCLG